MGFRFNLQRVLELREEAVKQCEQEVERLQRALVELKELLNSERAEYFREREELNEFLRAAQVDKVKIYDTSLEMRKQRMIQILQLCRQVECDLDFARQALIQARRGLKVLENLKERRFQEHRVKMERAERKQLDEHASIRHAREETLMRKARD